MSGGNGNGNGNGDRVVFWIIVFTVVAILAITWYQSLGGN